MIQSASLRMYSAELKIPHDSYTRKPKSGLKIYLFVQRLIFTSSHFHIYTSSHPHIFKSASRVFLHNDRSIMSPKTKSITQRCTHRSFLCFVKSEVKFCIKNRIVSKMVDGWRNLIVYHCRDGCNGLNGSGSA